MRRRPIILITIVLLFITGLLAYTFLGPGAQWFDAVRGG